MRVFLMLPLAALAACSGNHAPVETGGPSVSRSYPLRDFDAVELAGSDEVEVRTGGDFSISATGPKGDIDQLKLRVTDHRLVIDRESHFSFNWGGNRTQGVKLIVTLPAIHAAKLSGSGDMMIDRVANDFDGAIGGSGDLTIGALSGGKASLSVGGSGTLAAAGMVSSLTMNVAGSGDIDASGLKADSATVSIAGSGNAHAIVNGPAKVSIIGSGDADLGSAAQCTISKIGSGEVHCG